jgi:hypothetical protein
MSLEEAAKYAPLVTATIAVLAFVSAAYGIWSQRSIARKRAALDLFLKTELDKAMVDAYDKYKQGVKVLKDDTDMEEFCQKSEYGHIRSALNIHELVAVGIHNGVLDRKVCFEFWADELMDAYRDCKRVVEHARKEPEGSRLTYVDLERLNNTWMRRHRNRPERFWRVLFRADRWAKRKAPRTKVPGPAVQHIADHRG